MEERCIGAGGRGGYSASITSDRRLHGRLAAGPRVAGAPRLFSHGTGADGRVGGRGAGPAAERDWGVFNYWDMPPARFALAASVILLDLAIYLQHVMFHAVPLFWRLLRMHHADLDIDVTTGLRFHPLEIVLSMLIKFAVIAVLGAPVIAVVIFEVVLNASSMFNHGNVCLPRSADRWLRALIVTPDMHRVHHSIEIEETNSNFGFSLSLWDRLFGTYRAQPAAGHEGMTVGLRSLRDPAQCVRLMGMLRIPFAGAAMEYTLNRRRARRASGRRALSDRAR